MSFALLFPGQGAQSSGMGKELAEAFPESRAVFEEADDALGSAISHICFEGTADELALTENTQPAILTMSIAALRALEARGLSGAVAAAGHSLGEYSAHVAAGTVSFADAVRTVRLRGRFMQEAVPVGEGAMAAILGLDGAVIDEVCAEAAHGEVVSPANLNAPGQVVVAGHAAAVGRAVELAKSRGARKAVSVPVSAPFHCSLMVPAAQRLAKVLEEVPFGTPSFPVYTNVDAAPVTDGDAARDALVRQVASPVRWIDSIEAMVAKEIRTFVEVGPGKALSGMLRRIDRESRTVAVSDPGTVDKALAELGVKD